MDDTMDDTMHPHTTIVRAPAAARAARRGLNPTWLRTQHYTAGLLILLISLLRSLVSWGSYLGLLQLPVLLQRHHLALTLGRAQIDHVLFVPATKPTGRHTTATTVRGDASSTAARCKATPLQQTSGGRYVASCDLSIGSVSTSASMSSILLRYS